MLGLQPAMTRARRNEPELQEASKHLLYGLSQLACSVERLAEGEGDRVIYNALIESFVGHVRSTMEFFDSRPGAHADDIIAADFFDDPSSWIHVMPGWSSDLDRVRERANKQLAHLSYRRIGITVQDKRWSFIVIAQAIEPVVCAFIQHVPRHRLAPSWEPHLVGGPQQRLSSGWAAASQPTMQN
jgi:hypothetical protein